MLQFPNVPSTAKTPVPPYIPIAPATNGTLLPWQIIPNDDINGRPHEKYYLKLRPYRLSVPYFVEMLQPIKFPRRKI